jgi:hypothetical protein
MKRRYDLTFLLTFCEENNITLQKDYTNDKITRETIIIAKCIHCDDAMRKKSFRDLVENKNFGCY